MKGVRSIPDTTPAENRTLGWAALGWTRQWLRQPDGQNVGEPWIFTPEQARIVLRFYEIDAEGRFTYRRAVIRRMKGHGKDPLLAAIAATELCGPCRFSHFDQDGRPVAVAHPAPWIQVAAVSRDQTANTMRLFAGLFSPEALEEYAIDLGKTLIYARGVGQIEAVTSSPRALEGNRASLVILNESQNWLRSNDGTAMAEAIRRNLAKSNDGSARSVEIANAHLPGEGSVAEATYEAWRAVNGAVPGLLYDSLEAPAIPDLGDRGKVRAGLLAARGDSHWLDVDRLLDEIGDPVTPEHVARRFYLNQVVRVAAEHWMDMEAWDSRARLGQEIPEGSEVVLGFDGSRTGDATALVAVSLVAAEEAPHLQVVANHENVTGDPNFEVDMADVMAEIRDACRRWRVREITADLTYWQLPLRLLAEEGLPVVEMPQTLNRMAPATAAFYQSVASDRMTHDGDPDLRRHVANAVLVVGTRGDKLAKDSKDSPRKIDLAVASVMGLQRASENRPRAQHLWFVGGDELLRDGEPVESDTPPPSATEFQIAQAGWRRA
jgi:phage terminase large subunit-like protein